MNGRNTFFNRRSIRTGKAVKSQADSFCDKTLNKFTFNNMLFIKFAVCTWHMKMPTTSDYLADNLYLTAKLGTVSFFPQQLDTSYEAEVIGQNRGAQTAGCVTFINQQSSYGWAKKKTHRGMSEWIEEELTKWRKSLSFPGTCKRRDDVKGCEWATSVDRLTRLFALKPAVFACNVWKLQNCQRLSK